MTIVKICGLTNAADATAAIAAGADLLGFVFYSKSPRFITPQRAAEIVSALPRVDATFRTVGLFVNASLDEIQHARKISGVDLVQLHGDEPPHLLELLDGAAYKVLRPRSIDEAAADAEWYAELGPKSGPQLLLDTHHPNLFGGTGHVGDWSIAAALAPQYKILLAGGLTPDNVARAVRQVLPWGVDVSSGVEMAPGQKDHAKMQQFVREAKLAARKGRTSHDNITAEKTTRS